MFDDLDSHGTCKPGSYFIVYTVMHCYTVLQCFFCVKNRLCRQVTIIPSDLWIDNSSEHFGFYEPNAKIEGRNMYPHQNDSMIPFYQDIP